MQLKAERPVLSSASSQQWYASMQCRHFASTYKQRGNRIALCFTFFFHLLIGHLAY
jgi:hypothetical protein